MPRLALLPALLALLAHPVEGRAAPPAEAAARSRALVAAFTRVPAAKGPARDRAFAELDGFLALDELSASAVAPRAAKFKPEELARFQKTFREVLRLVAYGESGAFFRKARVTWGAAREAGDELAVAAKVAVPDEDLETEIEFRWKQRGSALRVVDVYFEGDSLLRDYQAQIARIVDKSGPAGVLKALEERRAEVEKGSGK